MGDFLSPTKDRSLTDQESIFCVKETHSQVIVVLYFKKWTKTKRPRCTLFLSLPVVSALVTAEASFCCYQCFGSQVHKNNVGSAGEGASAAPALSAFRPVTVESQISQVLKRENRTFCQFCDTCFRLAFLPHRVLRHLTVFVWEQMKTTGHDAGAWAPVPFCMLMAKLTISGVAVT